MPFVTPACLVLFPDQPCQPMKKHSSIELCMHKQLRSKGHLVQAMAMQCGRQLKMQHDILQAALLCTSQKAAAFD